MNVPLFSLLCLHSVPYLDSNSEHKYCQIIHVSILKEEYYY